MEIPLTTKFSRPRTARYYLPRPHLKALLQEGLSRRLTTLLATAGHGKTSTLSHFLSEMRHPTLWIQLDPRDSDLRTFLQYLAAGIRQELKAGSRLWTALAADRPLPDPLPLLIADLQECPDCPIIVLDDFHLIDKESPVVALISSLLQYADERTHLFICSRTPLPFSTARLKVTQEAGEITEEDLRFTREETQSFFQATAEILLEGEQLDQVCHLTEGWSAALVLMATGIRRRGGLEAMLGGALPNDLFAYLADEVFQSLNPPLQRFMEESSCLDILSPTACDDILQRVDSAAMLGYMASNNLLVMQLGVDSYRYHHLLQRFLQERLKARETGDYARLNKQAGDWFLGREEPEEAVKHYLRGGWLQEAAGLVESLAPVWLRTHRLERLRGLLVHLPQPIKEQYPWITICEARYLLNEMKPDHAVGMARMALRSFEELGDRRGVVQAHILLGECYTVRQETEAAYDEFRLAEKALQPDFRPEEALLLHRRAALTYMTSRTPENVEADLRRALSLFVEVGDLAGEAGVSDLLGVLRAQQGDHLTAIQLLERAMALLRSMGEPVHELGINLAWVYSEVGQLHQIPNICEPILALSSRKMRRLYAGMYLIYTYTRLGEFAKAAAIAPVVNGLVTEIGTPENHSDLTVQLSALYRLSGQSQAAVPFANEALQLARQTDKSHVHAKAIAEAILLHLFHTGNSGKALKLAEAALNRRDNVLRVLDIAILSLSLAVAQFRVTRTESRPEAVRSLQEALTECRRRGLDSVALSEWQLALAVVVYGLAYDVQSEYCVELIRLMQSHLATTVLQNGIPLMDAEARLLPAAWQGLPDDASRVAFSTLLTSHDRKRVVSLHTGPAPVRIQALGPLVVTVAGAAIDVKALKKRKSGQLLVLLIASENPLPREQVMDRFWPDLDPSAADTSLRVCLHHLRRLLEPHLGGKQKSRYLQTEGGLVWFSRQPEIQIDLDHFREAIRMAQDAREKGGLREAAAHFETACKIYQGDLAADEPYALEDVRDAWRSSFTHALDWLGEYYWHELQDPAKAIITFQRRLSLEETHEPAHQSLMRIFMETGHVAKARQQYLACKEALSTQLGVEPARTTESLLQLAISMESETAALTEPPSSSRRKR